MKPIKARSAVVMLVGLFLAACENPLSGNGAIIVSTLAGGGDRDRSRGAIYISGFADEQGSAARFNSPRGITIDAAGNLYVADWTSIRKVTPNGKVSTLAGGGERGFSDGYGSNAKFHGPHGIVINAAGDLYVADYWNSSIRKVTPNGEVSTLAGNGEGGFADGQGRNARFYRPSGIAIDAAGNLYVADVENHRIRKVTPEGEVSTLAGSGEKGFDDGQGSAAQFYRPSGIAIDAADNLYVADSSNHRIRKVAPKGEVSTLAGNGDFADRPRLCIKHRCFPVGGFANGQGRAARFDDPHGIAIDAAGNLYVADTRNNRIRKVTPEGKVSTLAGGYHECDDKRCGKYESTFVDGRGSVARFYWPYGITIDAVGNLYVADGMNYSIRKIVIQHP